MVIGLWLDLGFMVNVTVSVILTFRAMVRCGSR